MDDKTKKFLEKLYIKNPSFIGKFKLKSNFTKSSEYIIIEDKYGELKIRASNLMRGSFPTVFSAVNKYSYRANQFIEIHGDTYAYFEDFTCPDNIRIECKKCNKVLNQTIDAHLSGNGCYECGKKRSAKKHAMSYEDFLFYSNENGNIDIDFTSCGYTSLKHSVELRCTIHNEHFKQIAMYCKNGMNGCPSCKREKTSFLQKSFVKSCKNKTALIYVLKIYNEKESFFKIGITNRSVKKRFNSRRTMPYNYEILFVKENKNNPECIFNAELNLLNKYNNFKYTPYKKFSGYTECFTLDLPVEEILSYLEQL